MPKSVATKQRGKVLPAVIKFAGLSNWTRYRGKYPNNIRHVSYAEGWISVETMDFTQYRLRFADFKNIAKPIQGIFSGYTREREMFKMDEPLFDQLLEGQYVVVELTDEEAELVRDYHRLMNNIRNHRAFVPIDD